MPTGSLHSFPTHTPTLLAKSGDQPHRPALPRLPRVSPRPSAPRVDLSPHQVRGWRPGPPPPCPRRRGWGRRCPLLGCRGGARCTSARLLPPGDPPGPTGPRRRQRVTRGRGKLSEPRSLDPLPSKWAPLPRPPRTPQTEVMLPRMPRKALMKRRGKQSHTHPPSPPPQLFTSQFLQPTGRRHLGHTAPPPVVKRPPPDAASATKKSPGQAPPPPRT
jgi:hypothetical protein